jgi:hypothetical protein
MVELRDRSVGAGYRTRFDFAPSLPIGEGRSLVTTDTAVGCTVVAGAEVVTELVR